MFNLYVPSQRTATKTLSMVLRWHHFWIYCILWESTGLCFPKSIPNPKAHHSDKARLFGTGKARKNCHESSVVKCVAIHNNLPKTLLQDATDIVISKDKQYLYDVCKTTEVGEVRENVTKKEPGPPIHSRWLTTAK